MIISSISKINKINNVFNLNRKPQVSFSQNVDTFKRTTFKSADKIFDSGRLFKFDNYNALTEVQKKELLKKVPYQIKFDVEKNIQMGEKFKKSLDEKYGKDNYIFECIGTSPAGIGRYLEFTGSEVHYLPISGLKSLVKGAQLQFYVEDEGIKKYGEFLSSQGIKEGMDKETDKQILFYDYTDSWKTLHTFRNILHDYYGIPMEFENSQFEYRSLNEDLRELAETDQEENDIDLYIEAYLEEERIDHDGGSRRRLHEGSYSETGDHTLELVRGHRCKE